MNAREAYELCGLAAEHRRQAEKEIRELVSSNMPDVMRLISALVSEGSALLSSYKLNRGDLAVMTTCTLLQLSIAIEKLAKEQAGAQLARDN